MPSSPGTIIAERRLFERDGCHVSIAELDDGSRVVLRRVAADAGPTAPERIEALDTIRRAGLPGLVEILGTRVLQDSLEIREAEVEGFSLAAAIDPVQQHVTVNVALSLVHDVARALAPLHALTEPDGSPARLIHGSLGLEDILITRRGQTVLTGLTGMRGDLLADVEALMTAMRALLATRAINPKGSALLDRLAQLKFASCAELARAIEVYLARQDPEQLQQRRLRFTSAVLTVHRDPLLEAPFSEDETTVGAFEDASLSGHVLRGGGEAVAVGIALPIPPVRDDSIPSLDSSDLELVHEHTSKSEALPVLPENLIGSDTAETAAEALPEGFLEEVLTETERGDVEEDGLSEMSFGRRTLPPSPPPLPPEADEPETREVDDDARHGLLGRASPPEPGHPEGEERVDAVQVGHYRVVASIGRGGMGEIYLGREIKEGRLGRLVALKVMGMQDNLLETDEQALDMLLDEAKIMAHIHHPNVLQVVDFGKAHGRYYLATEYLEGRPLVRVMIEAYAKADGLDYGVIAALGAGAARGLSAAHGAVDGEGAPLRVVHRDVSPQNIFVTYDGITKVIDFGVARATERIAKTAVGLVKGKAAYMSPEQSEGREVDARSDVFSLGVCLWEMTAGCRLFKREIEYDTLLAVQSAPIEPPSVVRGDPNPVLDHIILNALARDRDRRTQSARDLAEQLEDYARGVGVGSNEEVVADLLERLFGEAKDKEQALIRNLEIRTATPEEVAQLEAVSGVAAHTKNFKEITLVGAPDSLSELDDFGNRHRRRSRVLEAVDRFQAEREGPPFDIAVTDPEPDATEDDMLFDDGDFSVDVDDTGLAPAEFGDKTEGGDPGIGPLVGEANTEDDIEQSFDVMPTARLPAELVDQVRSQLDGLSGDPTLSQPVPVPDLEPDPAPEPEPTPPPPFEPRAPTPAPLRATSAPLPDLPPLGASVPPPLSGLPLPEDDEGAFEPVPAEPRGPSTLSSLNTVPEPVVTAAAAPPAPSKRSTQLVVLLLGATFAALAVAGVLLWQMLPEMEDRGPTVALRKAPPAAATSSTAEAEAEPPDPAPLAAVEPGADDVPPLPEALPEPAEWSDDAPPDAGEAPPEPADDPVEAPEPAPAPVAAVEPPPPAVEPPPPAAPPPPASPPAPPPSDRVQDPPPPSDRVVDTPPPDRVVDAPPPPPPSDPVPERPPADPVPAVRPAPPKPSRMKAMLAAIEERGLDVTKSERTYMVGDERGGSVVVDGRASITSVKSGAVQGYIVRARASALTSVSWIGTRGGGPWLARGLSVNDCRARVRTESGAVLLRYGGAEQRLPAGGGVLFDVAVSVPANATRVVVEPLGISMGAKAAGAKPVHCRSGWWGKQVVLRRLPPGTYTLRWTGPEVTETATLVVSESGVENGVLKRVRRPS